MKKRLKLAATVGICLVVGFLLLRQWFIYKWHRDHPGPFWEPVKDTETGISVRIPGVPKESNSFREYGALRITVNVYISEVSQNTAFGLHAFRLPDCLENSEIQEIFADTENRLSQAGKVIASSSVTYRGFPGREFDLELLNGQARSRIRVVYAKRNVAILTVVMPSGVFTRLDGPELQRFEKTTFVYFFNSLEFPAE
jgi:hypothetical protein